jgi:hypothetical protein
VVRSDLGAFLLGTDCVALAVDDVTMKRVFGVRGVLWSTEQFLKERDMENDKSTIQVHSIMDVFAL